MTYVAGSRPPTIGHYDFAHLRKCQFLPLAYPTVLKLNDQSPKGLIHTHIEPPRLSANPVKHVYDYYLHAISNNGNPEYHDQNHGSTLVEDGERYFPLTSLPI
jgi:hypothetical protein